MKNKLLLLLVSSLFISCQKNGEINKQKCVVNSVKKIEREFNNIPSDPNYKIVVCDSMTIISNKLVGVGDTIEIEIIKMR